MEPNMKMEIDQMPPRGSYHRRAHSDTTFRFDDLLLFDPSDLDFSCLDLPDSSSTPALPPVSPVPAYSSGDSSSNGPPLAAHNNPRKKISSHIRSLSVDSDFFDGLGLTGPVVSGGGAGDEKFGGNSGVGEKRAHHRHSNSMDDSTTTSFEAESLMDGVKKTMSPDRLAELALIDPKRAKRILANRQSAARSKERKIRYTSELEKKVQTLQAEATNLSAQLTMLQRETTGLKTVNKELKLRLQAMEQQEHLRDALNEKLKEEVQRLRIQAGQMSSMNGNPYSRGLPPQFLPLQPALHHFGVVQTPQQQSQQITKSSSANNQTLNGQAQPRFTDFNQRA